MSGSDDHRGLGTEQVDDWLDQIVAPLGPIVRRLQSVKVSGGKLLSARAVVIIDTTHSLGVESAQRCEPILAEVLAELGLTGDAAHWISAASPSHLFVGSERDDIGPRHMKVYLSSPKGDWWSAMVVARPDVVRFQPPYYRPSGACDGSEPVFVAWKWTQGEEAFGVATYWKLDPAMTTHAALQQVYPDPRDDWVGALLSISRAVGRGDDRLVDVHDLVVGESRGRRSVDLRITDDVGDGPNRYEAGRLLGKISGLGSADADALIDLIAERRLDRLIGGLDGHGQPFATMYFVP